MRVNLGPTPYGTPMLADVLFVRREAAQRMVEWASREAGPT